MDAQFAFTDSLVDILKPALVEAGLDHIDVLVNPDDDGVAGGSLDDSVEFRLPDGSISPFYIQSGPYGVGVKEFVFKPDGSFHGSKPHRTFEVTMLGEVVTDLVGRLAEAHPHPVAPTP